MFVGRSPLSRLWIPDSSHIKCDYVSSLLSPSFLPFYQKSTSSSSVVTMTTPLKANHLYLSFQHFFASGPFSLLHFFFFFLPQLPLTNQTRHHTGFYWPITSFLPSLTSLFPSVLLSFLLSFFSPPRLVLCLLRPLPEADRTVRICYYVRVSQEISSGEPQWSEPEAVSIRRCYYCGQKDAAVQRNESTEVCYQPFPDMVSGEAAAVSL